MIDDETVIITLRDRDPLVVSKQLLVESSSVFTHIFVECIQTEHDMSDFPPEIVAIFLSLLDDRVVEEIAESAFRELHKITVVFCVDWLIKSCREWLLKKINSVGENTGYETLLYLFEECFYLYSKWNIKRSMEALILKVRFQDTTLFIPRYIRENNAILNDMNTNQLKYLLYLAGADTKVIMEVLLDRLNSREYLDDITRYSIEHINLPLCEIQNGSMYREMCERFNVMKGISNDDFRLVFKLITLATKENNEVKRFSTETIVHSVRSLVRYWDDCNSLTDITRLEFADHEGMFEVLPLLERAAFVNKLALDPREIKRFIMRLEELNLPKVSTKYIDIISEHIDDFIFASTLSSNDITHHLIKILQLIRNNEKLSSSYDTICLKGEKMPQSLVVNFFNNILGLPRTPDRFVFKMKIPGMTCNRRGECGFIIETNGLVFELSRDIYYYTPSGVHIHDELKAENMKWCNVTTYKLLLGFIPRADIFNIQGMRVFYNISDHLVAKF